MALIDSDQVRHKCSNKVAHALTEVLDLLESRCLDLEITWIFANRDSNQKYKNFECFLSLTDLNEKRLWSLAELAVSKTNKPCQIRRHSKNTIVIFN